MIELRWVGRHVTQFMSPDSKDGIVSLERVLQYRVQEEYRSGVTGNPFKCWSGWTDVPTVREEG